jgi:hypothetical protein
MRNRAKCKLCKSEIESFHRYDYVTCGCGEISISGGLETLECSARDWNNFLRIDEEGNEIIVKVKDAIENDPPSQAQSTPSKQELLQMLSEMISTYENLPQNAMSTPVTHYDLLSSLLLLSAILRSE